jgi:hypothetical protein
MLAKKNVAQPHIKKIENKTNPTNRPISGGFKGFISIPGTSL